MEQEVDKIGKSKDEEENAFLQLQQGIINYVEAITQNLAYDRTVIGSVTQKSEDEKRFTVKIDKINYERVPKLSHLTINIGDIVKLTVPQNNYNNIYIEGKIG